MNHSQGRAIAALFYAAAASLSLSGTLAALAASGDGGPGSATDVVKAKQTTMLDLVRQTPDGDDKLHAVVDSLFDYAGLASASLGTEWAPRSDAEKTQYLDLLKQFVRKIYERNLKKLVGYDIQYLGEDAVADDGAVIVKTRAKSKTEPRELAIEVGFRMAQKGGEWLDEDVLTEGVSLVASYGSQFIKIIRAEGFPSLIQKMKDAIAKGAG